jgi:hypothetical protein
VITYSVTYHVKDSNPITWKFEEIGPAFDEFKKLAKEGSEMVVLCPGLWVTVTLANSMDGITKEVKLSSRKIKKRK